MFAKDGTEHTCYILCLVYFINRTEVDSGFQMWYYVVQQKRVEPCETESIKLIMF